MSAACPKCGDPLKVYHGPHGYGFCVACHLMNVWDGEQWHQMTESEHRKWAQKKREARR